MHGDVSKNTRRFFQKTRRFFRKCLREFYKSQRFSQKDGSIQMPFKVNQHHYQKAEKDLHKAKVEFTLGEKGNPTRREGKSNKQKRICTRKEIPKCLLFQLHAVLGLSGVLRLSRLRFFGSSRNVARCEEIAVNQRMAAKRSRSLLDDGR